MSVYNRQENDTENPFIYIRDKTLVRSTYIAKKIGIGVYGLMSYIYPFTSDFVKVNESEYCFDIKAIGKMLEATTPMTSEPKAKCLLLYNELLTLLEKDSMLATEVKNVIPAKVTYYYESSVPAVRVDETGVVYITNIAVAKFANYDYFYVDGHFSSLRIVGNLLGNLKDSKTALTSIVEYSVDSILKAAKTKRVPKRFLGAVKELAQATTDSLTIGQMPSCERQYVKEYSKTMYDKYGSVLDLPSTFYIKGTLYTTSDAVSLLVFKGKIKSDTIRTISQRLFVPIYPFLKLEGKVVYCIKVDSLKVLADLDAKRRQEWNNAFHIVTNHIGNPISDALESISSDDHSVTTNEVAVTNPNEDILLERDQESFVEEYFCLRDALLLYKEAVLSSGQDSKLTKTTLRLIWNLYRLNEEEVITVGKALA